jgi:hypothetical protein
MQMTKSTIITLIALASFATPVFAKNTKAQKAETEDSSPTCSSYQLGPDGNWTPLPCQELGTNSSSQHRTPPKRHDEEAR